MSNLPPLKKQIRICVICEGDEECIYFKRLMGLQKWSSKYDFHPVNARSANNIPAVFQNEYQNDRNDLIIIFCDTEKPPYKNYNEARTKINHFLNKQKAHERITIFANPCTMQIILSHFGDVSLKTPGKKANAPEIERLTGVSEYEGHKAQIEKLCSKIFSRSYDDMKRRIQVINLPDTTIPATNFWIFLDRFESDDISWITAISEYLKKENKRD